MNGGRGESEGPRRATLGTVSLLALGVNGIVGVGIFFTPNVIAGLVPGRDGAWVYLVTAALLLPIAFVVATLGRCLPHDGGPRVWAEAAFGELPGFFVGWVAAVSAVASTAAVFAGIGTHLGAALGVHGRLGSLGVTAACLVVLGAVVASGLRPSAWVWNGFTFLKLVPLVALVGLYAVAPDVSVERVQDPARDYGRALLVALFPLQGFEVIPVLAGSVRRNSATLHVATLGSLGVAAILYAALHLACVDALPRLSAESAPLVAAARALGGASLADAMALGTNVSALGIAFGMLVMTPRYLAVLGTERGLGSWLGRFDERGVPRPALAVMIACVSALVFSERAVEALLVLASAAVLVQYVTALCALARLALVRRQGLSPLAAVPAALGLGAVVLLGKSLELREFAVLGAALAVGAGIWALRARRG